MVYAATSAGVEAEEVGVSIALALFLWGKGVGALRSLFEHELGMNARLSIGSGGSH